MAITNGSSDVWVWDPVKGDFRHPGEIPRDRKEATTRFIEEPWGPFHAKITRVSLLAYDKEGFVTVERDDGSREDLPKSRVLHWYEGLLLLQALQTSDQQVSWFTADLERVLRVHLAKNATTGFSPHGYVEQRLLGEAVTGAKYRDLNRVTHNFRRKFFNDKVPKDPATQEEVPGFWQIEKIAGYMPPWDAYQKFGVYQDFYLVHWQHPFSTVDYSQMDNGYCMLGATWEPDECLPPHMDQIRQREKQCWIERQRVADTQRIIQEPKAVKAVNGRAVRKRTINHAPQQVAKYRRDGRPLQGDLVRFKLGHDFQPTVPEAFDCTGWPREASQYPTGYAVASPPGFCSISCNCMDDGRIQEKWELEKQWLENEMRSLKASAAIGNLAAALPQHVRRRGQVSGMAHRFETLQNLPLTTSRSGLIARLKQLAAEVQTQIIQAMGEVPMQALFDRADEVRIPVLAFQALGHDYSPYFFALSPESFKHRHWLSVHPSKGLLTGRLEDGNPGTTRNLKVDLKYPDGKVGAIEFTVKDSPAHWESRTIRVVSVVKDLIAPESSLKNCWVILQDHLSEIYDFNCRNARQAPFGRWLQCMEKLLLMLRSLPTANLLREVPEAQLPKSAWNGPVLRV